VATFGRTLAQHVAFAPQNTKAGEELEEGWAVKMDPAEDGTVFIGTTAITDPIHGFVAKGTGDADRKVPVGSQFTLIAIGEADGVQVKDGETVTPGDFLGASTVKGKVQVLAAASTGSAIARGNAAGTGQTIVAWIGVGNHHVTA
jgi:hypothetical protein